MMSNDTPHASRRRCVLEAAWSGLAAALVVVGTACAVLFLPVAAVIAAAMDGVLLAVVALGVRQSALISLGRSDRRALARRLRRGVLGAALGAVTLAGLVRIAGPPALLMLIAVWACCPHLWSAAARARSAHSLRASDAGLAIRYGDRDSIHRLSRTELCVLWQASATELASTETADQLAQVSDLRRALLEELTHRDPEGIARWLNSGARANSDPGRYLRA
jgi:hypothetical protein